MCKIFDNQDHGFWHWVIKPWFQPEKVWYYQYLVSSRAWYVFLF